MIQNGWIAIGDIHGCVDQLKELLAQCKAYPQHKLVFLGNYIDKGPKPDETVQFLKTLDAVFLKGRHEDMLLSRISLIKDDVEIERILKNASLSRNSFEWLKKLDKALLVTPEYIFVPGALDPNLPLEAHPSFVCIWGNPQDDYPQFAPRFVVHGSVRTLQPVIGPHKASIHTGSGSGGKISAFVLPEKIILQSPPTPSKEPQWRLMRQAMEGLIEEL